MSYADKVFIETCRNILDNGSSTYGESVRARWEDGSPAYTKRLFGVSNTYDVGKEFPVITLRKTYLKSAMDEILWIYQKKSNKLSELHSDIWNKWAKDDNTIGNAYGYQVNKKISLINGKIMDQMDYVLYCLKNDPFNRRMVISLWNPEELHLMSLTPCAWTITLMVTKEDDINTLNMLLVQRSQDMLTASNWNVAQYAILLMILAQVSNMKVGKLNHTIADCHIYDRHIPIIEELLNRDTYDAPIVKLNPDIKDFYKFTTDDLIIENYVAGEQVQFEVAE